ncbi:MAG TPA: aldehyde dehydrogenase family protein [Ktedonobacteraceae bacterium]|nr:aldehyde dehydrogenase family protein [Ktedonobacteraceae bacterium]
MIQPVLLNGAWQQARDPEGTFQAQAPTTGESLPAYYPVSSAEEIEQAIQAGLHAVLELRSLPNSHEAIAQFLEAFASIIEQRSEQLVEMAFQETGLAREPRLRMVELPRTTNQLRQAAQAARNSSWCYPTIDTRNNIRSCYASLDGPVVVFGPDNFPFAFNSVAGGDFAAAIAAGNPVIGKANPGHPGTTQLLAEAALEALEQGPLPRSMVQLLYRTSKTGGFRLVSHPAIGATAFTGSRSAGLRLKEAADKAGKPIYLEMSSVNPVFLLPGALEERLPQIADEFCSSCLSASGQFCTNPGIVVLMENEQSQQFVHEAATRFQATPAGVLLHSYSSAQLREAIAVLTQHGAQLITGGNEIAGEQFRFENTLLWVSGDQFLEHPHALQTEAFGNVSLLIRARDPEQILAIAASLEGNLTGSIYSHTGGADDALCDQLTKEIRPKVGRLLNDKMPTGVAVSPAMMHGGPYPASGHPGFTAVGIPASMVRFGLLQSYDNVRPHRLPAVLQNKNPSGTLWRLIDGRWTWEDL